jgi:hypothetical protein
VRSQEEQGDRPRYGAPKQGVVVVEPTLSLARKAASLPASGGAGRETTGVLERGMSLQGGLGNLGGPSLLWVSIIILPGVLLREFAFKRPTPGEREWWIGIALSGLEGVVWSIFVWGVVGLLHERESDEIASGHERRDVERAE